MLHSGLKVNNLILNINFETLRVTLDGLMLNSCEVLKHPKEAQLFSDINFDKHKNIGT